MHVFIHMHYIYINSIINYFFIMYFIFIKYIVVFRFDKVETYINSIIFMENNIFSR